MIGELQVDQAGGVGIQLDIRQYRRFGVADLVGQPELTVPMALPPEADDDKAAAVL